MKPARALAAPMLAPPETAVVDDDRRLVDAFQRGEPGAFRALYERHYGRVARTAWRVIGNPTEAEDIAQIVFLRAHAQLARFEPWARLTTWLYRVTVNACLDHLKARHRRREQVGDDAMPRLAEGMAPAADELLEQREVQVRVARALRALPEKYRVVVVLRDMEERPYAELTEILGLPLTTVKMRAVRGRERLAEALRRLEREEGRR